MSYTTNPEVLERLVESGALVALPKMDIPQGDKDTVQSVQLATPGSLASALYLRAGFDRRASAVIKAPNSGEGIGRLFPIGLSVYHETQGEEHHIVYTPLAANSGDYGDLNRNLFIASSLGLAVKAYLPWRSLTEEELEPEVTTNIVKADVELASTAHDKKAWQLFLLENPNNIPVRVQEAARSALIHTIKSS